MSTNIFHDTSCVMENVSSAVMSWKMLVDINIYTSCVMENVSSAVMSWKMLVDINIYLITFT